MTELGLLFTSPAPLYAAVAGLRPGYHKKRLEDHIFFNLASKGGGGISWPLSKADFCPSRGTKGLSSQQVGQDCPSSHEWKLRVLRTKLSSDQPCVLKKKKKKDRTPLGSILSFACAPLRKIPTLLASPLFVNNCIVKLDLLDNLCGVGKKNEIKKDGRARSG